MHLAPAWSLGANMALTIVDGTRRPYSVDGRRFQVVQIRAASGDTSGTLTAPSLSRIDHCIMPHNLTYTAAPTYSNNVATFAFTVPAETAAAATVGGVTYTAVAGQGAGGNSITIAYTTGGTAGAEVITVTGTAISVQIQSGTSTITQVRTAVNASVAAAALVTATGTSATTVSAPTGPTALASGVNGGAFGDALMIGV